MVEMIPGLSRNTVELNEEQRTEENPEVVTTTIKPSSHFWKKTKKVREQVSLRIITKRGQEEVSFTFTWCRTAEAADQKYSGKMTKKPNKSGEQGVKGAFGIKGGCCGSQHSFQSK